jgi:beta-galactosidase/beta-glucuronidase
MKLRDSGSVWYDWWHYGGIVRDVGLVVQERATIRRQVIRTRIAARSATVTTRALLESSGTSGALRLEGRILGPSGEPVAEGDVSLPVGPTGAEPTLSFEVPQPEKWHFDQPSLYAVALTLRDGAGAVLDERTDTFGIRTVEIRDRGLWLNGERVRLTGVTRHEDSPWEGLAETRGTIRRDWDDLKALHVVLTRPVHYPQHPYVSSTTRIATASCWCPRSRCGSSARSR